MRKLLVALALWLAPWPVHAADPQPCGYQVGNIGTVVKTHLDALRADAFAEAYGAYVTDLDRLQTEHDRLVSDVREYTQGPCRSYNEAFRIYEADALAWNNSICVRGPVTEDMVGDCAYRKSQLDMRRNILVDRRREFSEREADLERRARALAASAELPLRNAAIVLDPDHVEEALRLYISWLQRSAASDSCYSFARIAEKLGQRVADRWAFLELLARNLTPDPTALRLMIRTPSLTPFAFDSSGFQSRFMDPDPSNNQVRHAIAYMVFGYSFSGNGASLVADIRDRLKGEVADYLLGVEAGYMGFKLRDGTYATSDFGGAIEARLCR